LTRAAPTTREKRKCAILLLWDSIFYNTKNCVKRLLLFHINAVNVVVLQKEKALCVLVRPRLVVDGIPAVIVLIGKNNKPAYSTEKPYFIIE
jgi:hypothetical protein